jgi:hypothetical protein
MLHRLLVAVAACLLVGTASARAADESGASYVEVLYAKEWPGTGARYSPSIAALWDACEDRPDAEEEPCMDFDFFVMAQDFDIKDFKVESLSDDGNAARVKASRRCRACSSAKSLPAEREATSRAAA